VCNPGHPQNSFYLKGGISFEEALTPEIKIALMVNPALASADCCKASPVLKMSSPLSVYLFAFGFAVTLFSALSSSLALLYFQPRYL